jgi:hypothetical protein
MIFASFRKCFPRVFVGLKFSVRKGGWNYIGALPIEQFQFSIFRSSFNLSPGMHADWRLWDGKEFKFIGKLPPELYSLELDLVWSEWLALRRADRICRNPFEEVR